MLATKPKPKLARPLVVYYGRIAPPEWLALRFPVRDYRVAILEVFHKVHCGQLSRREAEGIQRRVLDAVREVRA